MKLKSLTILNFKGIKSLTLQLDGQSASIYGDNATGKTSIYDAFLWLLFGKDSRGASNFSIKPIVNGEALHNVETHVEADIETDDGTMNLIRKYREVWTRRRGDAEDTFSGHETLYYVDGLPVNQANYKKTVESIMPENLFRVLTNPFQFPENLKWQDRRSQLFSLFSSLTDADIASEDETYMDLLSMAGRHSVEEYMAALKVKARGYNQELRELPARMDEVSRSIIDDDDEGEAELIVESLANEIRNLKQAIESTGDEELVAQRVAIETEILQLQNKNNAYRERVRVQNAESHRVRMNDIAGEIKKLKVPQIEAELATYKAKQEDLEKRLEDLRARFAVVASEPYVAQDTCPCCGRPYAPADMEAAKASWEAHRAERLDEINTEGRKLAESRNAARLCVQKASEELDRRTALRDQYEASMETLRSKELAEDFEGYADQMNELTKRRESILDAISKARDGAKDKLQALSMQLAERQTAYIAAKNALATIKASVAARARMEELHAHQLEVVGALENAEETIALCEEFIKARIARIEESINSHFDLVRWQLYRDQINGGVEEICEASVDGVPYHDLNGAMRINAGLDIIYACSKASGQTAPIFIDNAESVVDLFDPGTTQVIRLVVSEADAQLRLQK